MMNNRPGDWNCRSCFHLNFQRRESCQRCGDSKPAALVLLQDHYSTSGGGGYVLRASAASSNSPFGGGSFTTIGQDVRPGDWYCTVGNCGAHNFASRSTCFKCGASKLINDSLLDHHHPHQYPHHSPVSAFDPADHMSRAAAAAAAGRISPFSPNAFAAFTSATASNTSRSGWKSGDWICPRSSCNEHNFASRMECFKCNAPRMDTNTMSYY